MIRALVWFVPCFHHLLQSTIKSVYLKLITQAAKDDTLAWLIYCCSELICIIVSFNASVWEGLGVIEVWSCWTVPCVRQLGCLIATVCGTVGCRIHCSLDFRDLDKTRVILIHWVRKVESYLIPRDPLIAQWCASTHFAKDSLKFSSQFWSILLKPWMMLMDLMNVGFSILLKRLQISYNIV